MKGYLNKYLLRVLYSYKTNGYYSGSMWKIEDIFFYSDESASIVANTTSGLLYALAASVIYLRILAWSLCLLKSTKPLIY